MADQAQNQTEETMTSGAESPVADTLYGEPVGGSEEVAAEGATILGGDAADAADVVDAAAGADERIPETYKLIAPEGMAIDPRDIEAATPVFRELGLNNEQANRLMPVAADFAKRIHAQGQQAIMNEVTAQRRAWAEEAQADAELGGHRWAETQALSARALDLLGYPKGSSFRNFLTDSGLGNHPEMIRAFRRIGTAIGEDSDFVRADAAAPSQADTASTLYPNERGPNDGRRQK